MERVRIGMIGGGEGAFIGAVHRAAMRLDGRFDLLAGAFSRDAARSACSGRALGVAPDRSYPTYAAMIAAEESALDAVAVVTPNDTHAEASALAAQAGLAVICDKPATRTLAEAMDLGGTLAETRTLYALTHAYLGYPLVHEAQARIARGDLGVIRRVDVRYVQGWLAKPDGSKQADWRTDPVRAGAGGATGDIGTHAMNLAEFVSGARVEALACDLRAAVPERALDDDASALLRLSGGVRGTLVCSQVCAGEENGLRLTVSGDEGTLSWRQEAPNTLTIKRAGGETLCVRAGQGAPGLTEGASAMFRTPMGHPEGYLEAFAALYGAFADAVLTGERPAWLPGIEDGVRGLAFVEAMVASSARDATWVSLDKTIRKGAG